MAMSFSEGNRNYGLQILNLIHTLCPELYPTMIKEQKNVRNADDGSRQTNEGSTQQPVEEAQTEQSAEATNTEDTQQQAENVADQQDSMNPLLKVKLANRNEKEGAPEKYEFNDKVADAPEVLDPEVLTAFGEVAKQLTCHKTLHKRY